MKNYKNMRHEPYIYGFSVKGFFVFAIGLVLSLLVFVTGFSLLKFLFSGVFIVLFYVVGKLGLSNSNFMQKLMDYKLPVKFSDYE